jgi:recombination DNA repair RAD52 pathway protein
MTPDLSTTEAIVPSQNGHQPAATVRAAYLADLQRHALRQAIAEGRVCYRGPHGYVQAWDDRRTMNQIFGHDGWSTAVETTEVRVIEQTAGAIIRFAGTEFEEKSPHRWMAAYRSTVTLTVRFADGVTVTHMGSGAGQDTNVNLGAAVDQAMNVAESLAFKRAAMPIGDPFGLSLYNESSLAPVVGWTIPTLPAEDANPQVVAALLAQSRVAPRAADSDVSAADGYDPAQQVEDLKDAISNAPNPAELERAFDQVKLAVRNTEIPVEDGTELAKIYNAVKTRFAARTPAPVVEPAP